jgi:hypothetical protein
MGTFTITFSDVDGSVEEVDTSKGNVERIELKYVKLPSHIDPAISFYQTIALNCIHIPGSSICSIVIGGVLYKWC